MPTTDVNGATIHYDQAGERNADVLVLLHGFAVDSGMWAAQVDALSTRWRVVAVDYRGCGRSGPAGPFSIEQLAEDVHALAGRLGLGRVVLAGLSMGGYVALAYARRYGAALRGLILVDTKAAADTAEAREQRDKMIRLVERHGTEPVADAMIERLVSPETAAARPAVVRELRRMMEAAPPAGVVQSLAAMRDRADQTAFLSSIAVPTLIVVGEKDVITPVDVARGMAEKIPGAEVVVVPGVGHMSPMEAPGEVNAAMGAFLSRI
jgi:3-oxoadipate enol-lactonase